MPNPALTILDARSRRNLQGVREPLQRVICRMAEHYDFGHGTGGTISYVVIDGRRTELQQRAYFDSGKSRTMDSYHLTGDAADIACFRDGKPVWEPFVHYEILAQRMFQCAHIERVILQWGGHFCSTRGDQAIYPFRDGVHFQIPRERDLITLLSPQAIGRAAKANAERKKPAAAKKPAKPKAKPKLPAKKAPAPVAKPATVAPA